jgi:hypothetical protein
MHDDCVIALVLAWSACGDQAVLAWNFSKPVGKHWTKDAIHASTRSFF